MSKKILVINGHGAKKEQKIQIGNQYSILTPGNAEDSYVLSFDNQNRHLEEMTYQNKIWPITNNAQQIDWQHYSDTSLHDISITPLQGGFNFQTFARGLIAKTIPWGKLTQPEHNVLERGALAVRSDDGRLFILENQALIEFLKQSEQGTAVGTPVFFCDKELGKVKPMGMTTLSEMHAAIGMIDEFKKDGAAIIVATCSPNSAHVKSIQVQTYQNPLELSSVIKVPQNDEKPVSPPPGAIMSKEIRSKSAELLSELKFEGIKFFPRTMNYKPDNPAHNLLQPVESVQFQFQSNVEREAFKASLNKMPGFDDALVYDGYAALLPNPPIIQLTPDFILSSLITLKTLKENTMPKNLTDLLNEIEQTTGSFSTYSTVIGHGQDIPFENKPAQKFLSQLGVTSKKSAKLSTKNDGVSVPAAGNDSVTVTGFDPSTDDKLVITGARVDRLVKSAKTYVNTDIFPEGQFADAIANSQVGAQDPGVSPKSQLHWQNMAVGLCHVQEIDLLVEQVLHNGQAICAPRKGTIDENAPALLLLSTPALNFAYGTARALSEKQRLDFVAGMYRNLFTATLSEGRNYIALPAAGLGVFGGNPKMYFATLMEVAKEFPQLNIIYHPAANGVAFDEQLALNNPGNVIKARKDVMFIANELTQKGYPCAFHNPSDSDVVYGVYDVGEYWKTGKGAGYVGEEHVGAMTTAPLNSLGLNPQAYLNVVEHSFTKTKKLENPAVEKDVLKKDDEPKVEKDEVLSPPKPVVADEVLKKDDVEKDPLPSPKKPDLTDDALKKDDNAKKEVNIELEKRNQALITNKLLPLTQNYLTHLTNSAKNLDASAKELVDNKIAIVGKLLDSLKNDLTNPQPSDRVKSFYTELNAAESKLQAHRDPLWQRFVTNAVICAGILLTGILPGLAALAIYANTGDTAGKSMQFWKSHGANVVDELKKHEADVDVKPPCAGM